MIKYIYYIMLKISFLYGFNQVNNQVISADFIDMGLPRVLYRVNIIC